MEPCTIDREKLILTRDIPPRGTSQAAVVTYLGNTLVVPIEMYEKGEHRIEFIKRFGVPLPKAPDTAPEFFSPNILELLGE